MPRALAVQARANSRAFGDCRPPIRQLHHGKPEQQRNDGGGDCGPGARCKNNQCIPNTCATNEDCGTGETCQAGVCAKGTSADKCNWSPIRFGFNESALTGESRLSIGHGQQAEVLVFDLAA